jgi:hypothetical protein
MRQLHYGVGVRTTDPAWWEYIDGLRDIHDLTPRSHADHHKQSLTPYLPFFFTWHTTPNVADALAGLSNDQNRPVRCAQLPKHIRSTLRLHVRNSRSVRPHMSTRRYSPQV